MKVIAVFTSGGDAPGMNAALRAITGVALTNGARVFAILHGYRGLVEGGENFRELHWENVVGILHRGGTRIGSARCMEFKERAGQLRAAENLIKHEINNLVAIGGDGTLTGAHVFRSAWQSLVAELQETGRITAEQAARFPHLNIVGLVGSIDNDMCGFSMTIGCDTALHRIVDAVDALVTTAESHERTFIVEVMGRDCGYLALMSAIACSADWVFLPEDPARDGWEAAMCTSLSKRDRRSLNYSLVILSEGATDQHRNPITSAQLKKLLEEKIGHDTRITCLGHVQRGGSPSAYDRILATRSGAEAALALLRAKEGESMPPRIIGVRWNKMVSLDLMESVQQTREVNRLMRALQFPQALALRGRPFHEEIEIYRRLRRLRTEPSGSPLRVVVLHAGAPAAGMNGAVKTVVRYFVNGGHTVFGANDGFEGLALGKLVEMSWPSVAGWTQLGGALLGTKRARPSEIERGVARIAATLEATQINGLIIIGGFEAYSGLLELFHARSEHPALRIPMVCVPATISNNVPGTDVSLGCDTALNAIVEAVDCLVQSAGSSRSRVFLVETMGGYCGYLATLGALAGGADDVFTHEEGLSIDDLQADIVHLRSKLKRVPHAVLIRNEKCSEGYTSEFITSLLREEGRDPTANFSARSNILGHLQQGGAPSPCDRVRAARLCFAAARFLETQVKQSMVEGKVVANTPESASVVGIHGAEEISTPLAELEKQTDFVHRLAKQQWWTNLVHLVRMLENNTARSHDYKSECEEVSLEEPSCLVPN